MTRSPPIDTPLSISDPIIMRLIFVRSGHTTCTTIFYRYKCFWISRDRWISFISVRHLKGAWQAEPELDCVVLLCKSSLHLANVRFLIYWAPQPIFLPYFYSTHKQLDIDGNSQLASDPAYSNPAYGCLATAIFVDNRNYLFSNIDQSYLYHRNTLKFLFRIQLTNLRWILSLMKI